MAKTTYCSILRAAKYEKAHSSNAKKSLINASYEYAFIKPSDVKKIKIIIYEKVSKDNMIISTCYLQFLTLKSGIKLRHMTFSLIKKIELDDWRFKRTVTDMMNEQFDIEEQLDDIGFTKL